jgi:hypothetical protein
MRIRGKWLMALLLAGWKAPLHGREGHQAPLMSAVETHYFSALNKQEKPVLGLAAREFELRVNGTLRTLGDFRAGLPHTDRSIPLVAWILIDFNPNINATLIKKQADAAADIFKLFHPDSRAGVQVISDRAETLAPLGHDPAALRRAFQQFGARRSQLRVGTQDDSIYLGPAGMARAIELAVGDIRDYIKGEPSLAGREVHRAVMILSDGNIDPSYKTRRLYENAGRDDVFLYPVFIPRRRIGPWVEYYFALAKKSGGVASLLGALVPGSNPLKWTGQNTADNALSVNFIHMARDLNGKYSFTLPVGTGRGENISLKCKEKGVQIRLPRKRIP